MNNLRNKVQLIGHLGKDPEIKNFDSGKKMANLSLATNENYSKPNGDKVEQTQWHTLIAWGKLAEIAEKFLHKGNEIAIDGKLQYRSYEDKNGDQRNVTEILIQELLMIGKK